MCVVIAHRYAGNACACRKVFAVSVLVKIVDPRVVISHACTYMYMYTCTLVCTHVHTCPRAHTTTGTCAHNHMLTVHMPTCTHNHMHTVSHTLIMHTCLDSELGC